MEVDSIYDIPGLERLRSIAEEFGVRFKIIGSLPRRVLLSQMSAFEPQTLWDLVPFTSDIDLIHSGDSTQTRAITNGIFRQIPFSETFRWQVASERERSQYDEFVARYADWIADNRIWIDDTGLHDDRDAARGEYSNGELSFVLNPDYHSSALFREGRDLPILGVLLYLRNALQLSQWIPNFKIWNVDSFQNASKRVEQSSSKSALDVLNQNSHVANRLIYLYCAMALAARNHGELADVLGSAGLFRFVERLHDASPAVFTAINSVSEGIRQRRPVIVPAAVGRAQFRTAFQFADWEIESAASSRVARLAVT